MVTHCPKCKAENPDESKFCNECGLQMDSIDQMPAPPTQTLESPREELTTGSTFAGRYQIIEELGRGGMGRVYRALDKKLNEEVALKLIKPEIASDKKTLERFQNELKLARKIRHSNVGGMYELLEDKGLHYITMEYVTGEDLKSFISRSGRLIISKAINVAIQICEGLTEAHKLGVIHRDLKPSNIMIDKVGNARIMDFGIARSMKGKGITGAGMMIGTPEYLSPEQAETKEVDHRSDIYSLGVILYEMVTGQRPFEGETAFCVARKHADEIPRDPKEINPQIPEDLNGVILKCLEKDKEKRYQSASELHTELENVEKGIPTTDREIPKRKPLTSKEITVTFGLKKLFVPALIFITVVIIGLVIWQLLPEKEVVPSESVKPSIAVLPFEDLSPQKDQAYLCDGFAESIINALAKVEDLRVPAPTSSFSFKGREIDLSEIGEKLKVNTVLRGSVQKAEERIRITAQLINVADASLIWSEQYNQKLDDVFAIQDKISLMIVDKLKVKLLDKERAGLTKRYTENLKAYNQYLRGRFFSSKHTEEGFNKSIEHFKKAIDFDPNYALAYVGLAHCYKELARLSYIPPKEGNSKSKVAILKALELDDALGEAYAILASLKFIYDWDMSGPEVEFQRAIELSPNSVDVYKMYAQYLTWIGRYSDAIIAAKRATELDPLTPLTNGFLGVVYFYAGRYDESISQLREILELEPNFVWAHIYLASNYAMKGMFAEANSHADKVESLGPSVYRYVGCDYAKSGEKEKARKILGQLLDPSNEGAFDHITIATIYAGLDEKEKAFYWLNKGYEARSGLMVYLKAYGQTFFKDLSLDPRYIELLKKIGFE